MLLTTLGALIYKAFQFFAAGDSQGIILGIICTVLIGLALYIAIQARDVLLFLKSEGKNLTGSHPGWAETNQRQP
jgi:hypothetical protein